MKTIQIAQLVLATICLACFAVAGCLDENITSAPAERLDEMYGTYTGTLTPTGAPASWPVVFVLREVGIAVTVDGNAFPAELKYLDDHNLQLEITAFGFVVEVNGTRVGDKITGTAVALVGTGVFSVTRIEKVSK